jgi:hypothetical protein
MTKYKVEMILELTDCAGHPRKWLEESIALLLLDGEDILEWNISPWRFHTPIIVDGSG